MGGGGPSLGLAFEFSSVGERLEGVLHVEKVVKPELEDELQQETLEERGDKSNGLMLLESKLPP